MAPLSGRISTNGNIPHQEQQHEDESIIAQPIPRSKPIEVPSPLWPRQSGSREGQSASSFELLQQHVNQMSQQSNDREGNIISPRSSALKRQSSYNHEEDDDQEFIKCIASSPNDSAAGYPLKSILIHHPSSVPNDVNPLRGTPFFDATDATMAPPARPQTSVHFSNSPPQVFQYPPSEEYQHYLEKKNNDDDSDNSGGLMLLPWPEEESEAYKKQQEEKEKKMQARLQKINESWI